MGDTIVVKHRDSLESRVSTIDEMFIECLGIPCDNISKEDEETERDLLEILSKHKHLIPHISHTYKIQVIASRGFKFKQI